MTPTHNFNQFGPSEALSSCAEQFRFRLLAAIDAEPNSVNLTRRFKVLDWLNQAIASRDGHFLATFLHSWSEWFNTYAKEI